MTDDDLYLRGLATVLASWEVFARGSRGASVRRFPGGSAAVFPTHPERRIYNNAILGRDLPSAGRAGALAEVEAAYAAAEVDRFAVWVHERDRATRTDLEGRGYVLVEWTLAMGTALDDLRVPRPDIDLGTPDWPESLRTLGLPPDFLERADRSALHLALARHDGENVATALALDHDGDCGIYNVGTLPHARRRGLATALTAFHLHDALARGCRTASVQSTPAAERVYAAVGFRSLGRILEYAPIP